MSAAHPGASPSAPHPPTAVSTAEFTVFRRTALMVGGMHCDSCVRHVRDALSALPGVTAEVDLAAGRVTVAHPASVLVPDLVAALDDAGYAAGEESTRGTGSR